MKCFGVLAILLLASVATSYRVPYRQSCIDLKKALLIAATGPGECSKLAEKPEQITEAEGELEVSEAKRPVHLGGNDRLKQAKMAYNCFMEANKVRDASTNGTSVANLKTAIGKVAKSQEKSQAISAAIDNCVGNAATIPKAQRRQTLICVLRNVFLKGICKPEGPTSSSPASV